MAGSALLFIGEIGTSHLEIREAKHPPPIPRFRPRHTVIQYSTVAIIVTW